MLTLHIDHGNNGSCAEAFWGHLTAHGVIPLAPLGDEAREAVERPARSGCSVDVDEEVADEIRGWFETLPGWTGGPRSAPHPVHFTREAWLDRYRPLTRP